jgi:cell division protein YceG involved in septum cleavage
MVLSPLNMMIMIAVVVVLLAAGFCWLYMRRRKTKALRLKDGSEYNRAVLEHGSGRKAEAKLAEREKRIEKFTIRDLDASEHERFTKKWKEVQARFVDSPKGAVMEADDLISALKTGHGLPWHRVPRIWKPLT